MGKLLDKINYPSDLRQLSVDELPALCDELREDIVNELAVNPGHLASSLGALEFTVALHYVYNTPEDRIVWDVGHQAYGHKILTGRRDEFHTNRKLGGIKPFPSPDESIYDAFVAGHASSSVSIALGMARARTLQNEKYEVAALIGDGAATGGIAYEGLNDAAVSKEPIVVILNDNELSIDRNVGGMAFHLRKLRTKERYLGMKQRSRKFLNKIPGGDFLYNCIHKTKDKLRRMLIPTTIFENMGFTYLGPVDGHDTEHLIFLLQRLHRDQRRKFDFTVFVNVISNHKR